MAREQVLLIVTPTVSGEQLREAVPPARLSGSDLKVVVPAVTSSALAYWFSDQRAIAKARQAADELVDAIAGETATAMSASGDCDPALAVEDALATFPADRIIVVHRADHPGYREEKIDAPRLEKRLGREIEEHLVAA